jgi:hypothetical protein
MNRVFWLTTPMMEPLPRLGYYPGNPAPLN